MAPPPGQRGRCRSDRLPSRPQPAPPALRTWSPPQTRWLLLRHAEQQAQAAGEGHWAASTPGEALDAQEVAYVERLVSQSAELATAQTLTYQFLTLVPTGDASARERWFTAVEHSGPPELASFAAGLRRDRAAVAAALTSPWSNGQTAGQVNRLKTITRHLYGRAGFALLRQRVLRSA
jgi:Transposase